MFRYDQDTKRCHRFIIEIDSADVKINGTIYIAKGHNGLPKRIVLEYKGRKED